MASVEMWQGEHEKVCADRYRGIMAILFLGLSILIAVAGWGLNKVYDGQADQLRELRAVRTEVSAPAHP